MSISAIIMMTTSIVTIIGGLIVCVCVALNKK